EERQALAKQVEDDGRSIEDPEAKASRAAKSPPPAPKPATPAAPIRKPSIAQRRPGEMPPATSRGGSAPRSSGSAATAPAADAGTSAGRLRPARADSGASTGLATGRRTLRSRPSGDDGVDGPGGRPCRF